MPKSCGELALFIQGRVLPFLERWFDRVGRHMDADMESQEGINARLLKALVKQSGLFESPPAHYGDLFRSASESCPRFSSGLSGRSLSRVLTDLMQNPLASPDLRLEAGRLAAESGAGSFDLDTWVAIPADRLEYQFEIGKYPVTNAQYQRFVDDGGYQRSAGWFSEEAQREILEFEQNFAKGEWPRYGPRYGEAAYLGCLTLPVTRVSWYEAQAYTSWLTVQLRRCGKIEQKKAVRLPRMAEWRRALEGVEGQEYSWKGSFDASRSNTRESRLGQPSPVHMYPSGATPEGVFDLTGNVWEWMADSEGDGIFALAGGAYWNDLTEVGSAAERRNDGYFRPGDVGFRVVIVPKSLI